MSNAAGNNKQPPCRRCAAQRSFHSPDALPNLAHLRERRVCIMPTLLVMFGTACCSHTEEQLEGAMTTLQPHPFMATTDTTSDHTSGYHTVGVERGGSREQSRASKPDIMPYEHVILKPRARAGSSFVAADDIISVHEARLALMRAAPELLADEEALRNELPGQPTDHDVLCALARSRSPASAKKLNGLVARFAATRCDQSQVPTISLEASPAPHASPSPNPSPSPSDEGYEDWRRWKDWSEGHLEPIPGPAPEASPGPVPHDILEPSPSPSPSHGSSMPPPSPPPVPPAAPSPPPVSPPAPASVSNVTKPLPVSPYTGIFVCGDGNEAEGAQMPSTDGYDYCYMNTQCPCGMCCFCKCHLVHSQLPPVPKMARKSRRRLLRGKASMALAQHGL